MLWICRCSHGERLREFKIPNSETFRSARLPAASNAQHHLRSILNLSDRLSTKSTMNCPRAWSSAAAGVVYANARPSTYSTSNKEGKHWQAMPGCLGRSELESNCNALVKRLACLCSEDVCVGQ